MGVCTQFCEGLKLLNLEDGRLPSHDDLIVQLGFSRDDGEQGRSLGTWADLRRHKQCGFCQLVVNAISGDAESADAGTVSPDQPIRVLIFPGERAFRLSYPSRLGLRLAFVTDVADHASGPDNARPLYEPGVQIPRVKEWLKVCNSNHKSCSPKAIDKNLVMLPSRLETFPQH